MDFNLLSEKIFSGELSQLTDQKLLISTINAHSFNLSQTDPGFSKALRESDVLLPDGISIIWALRLLFKKKLRKIAGADLFFYEMDRINKKNGKCFFLGSSVPTLQSIYERASAEFPNIIITTYSPPFKAKFNSDDNFKIISAINTFKPDVLFIGMTAPKQEKWAREHFDKLLGVGHICCIGAVFDFYARTISRAPKWLISIGLEWLFRLVKEPRRLWRRYLKGNSEFILLIFKEMWKGM